MYMVVGWLLIMPPVSSSSPVTTILLDVEICGQARESESLIHIRGECLSLGQADRISVQE